MGRGERERELRGERAERVGFEREQRERRRSRERVEREQIERERVEGRIDIANRCFVSSLVRRLPTAFASFFATPPKGGVACSIRRPVNVNPRRGPTALGRFVKSVVMGRPRMGPARPRRNQRGETADDADSADLRGSSMGPGCHRLEVGQHGVAQPAWLGAAGTRCLTLGPVPVLKIRTLSVRHPVASRPSRAGWATPRLLNR